MQGFLLTHTLKCEWGNIDKRLITAAAFTTTATTIATATATWARAVRATETGFTAAAFTTTATATAAVTAAAATAVTTTTAAAVAAAAFTTTAAAAKATTTGTGRTLFHGTCFVDNNATAAQRLTVHAVDRGLGFII